jgi:thiamine biosynthesis lipoprotein
LKRLVLLFLGIFAVLALLVPRKTAPAVQRLNGQAMGCSWTLLWRDADVDPHSLQAEIAAELEHWEQVMSTWREDSDLCRHNRGEPASEDLAKVLRVAEVVRKESGGAFDERCLEMVHRAGFGPVGQGIDLSAIGKGYAVDRVADLLRKRGVNDFLFQLAGETIAGDGAWEVALEHPDPATSTRSQVVRLQRQAMATSGNYRQFQPTTNADAAVISHIIDPRTGSPVRRKFCSVTVISAQAASADAWATALFVLGPDHPQPTAVQKVIWQHGEDLRVHQGRNPVGVE